MLVWDLWFTITTLVLRLRPRSPFVIDHKSHASKIYSEAQWSNTNPNAGNQ